MDPEREAAYLGMSWERGSWELIRELRQAFKDAFFLLDILLAWGRLVAEMERIPGDDARIMVEATEVFRNLVAVAGHGEPAVFSLADELARGETAGFANLFMRLDALVGVVPAMTARHQDAMLLVSEIRERLRWALPSAIVHQRRAAAGAASTPTTTTAFAAASASEVGESEGFEPEAAVQTGGEVGLLERRVRAALVEQESAEVTPVAAQTGGEVGLLEGVAVALVEQESAEVVT
ncbi:MAG: hypothetical protein GY772_30485 [bacterium]|nr:hypothetical protein [bacterium]